MTKPTIRDLYKTRNELPRECVILTEKLFKAGLYRTAQKMHEVVREIGWELSAQIEARNKEERGANTD